MQHLDEGTIHAWLDGELPPAERAQAEAHIAECAECAAAVAEARGFVAASSRILTALDSVPGGVLPAASTGSSAPRPVVRRRFMTSRAWMAAAAVLVLSTVTVIATRPHGDAAQFQIAAASREQKELPASPAPESVAPSEKRAQTMKPSEQPQAAAQASGNAISSNTPAPMQSRAAAPVAQPRPVDQNERLKSRLESERQLTRVRSSTGAPAAMADAAPPAAPDSADAKEIAGPRVTISGRVTSEAGAPLASASVTLAGTNISAVTSTDGSYELVVPAARANGDTTSLVARLIGYESVAAPIALTSAAVSHDFVLASNPLALSEVVVSGAGVASAPRKPGAVTGTDESPVLVSRRTSAEAGDSVVTTIYAVGSGTVTLIERSAAADASSRRKRSADFSDQVMAKARDDARINSITWSDSSGRMRTLRGAVPREELERVRTALFGPRP
jgi:hypothetical protein